MSSPINPRDPLLVLSTAPDAIVAQTLARTLVDEQLAACVNLVGPIRSIYRWEGAICDDAEHLLLIKTCRGQFEALRARVLAMHPYQVPEVVALTIADGSAAYLAWLVSATAAPASPG
jgi:periplasmic divalent cation tolerance protein